MTLSERLRGAADLHSEVKAILIEAADVLAEDTVNRVEVSGYTGKTYIYEGEACALESGDLVVTNKNETIAYFAFGAWVSWQKI